MKTFSFFKEDYPQNLFIAFKMTYFSCFDLSVNLDFLVL